MVAFTKKSKKALIIGIDGVPSPLLETFARNGVMPYLGEKLGGGYRLHPMKASLPEISSVSWTSFMTGLNPAEHGIFGFTHLKPGSYDLHFTNSKDIKAPTFWQTLAREKKIEKALVLNVPNTYPAFPIEGLLVSGFVAIDFERAVYPPSYVPLLKGMNYIIDVDAEKAREDKQAFYQDILKSLSARAKVSLALLERESWDLVILCVTETDRLHHFFYDQKETPVFEEVYRIIDRMIEELDKAAKKQWGEDFLLMILSDHGFSLLKQEVNLNAYLARAGLLKLDPAKEYYDRISGGTIGFAMDPGRIYVHEEGRFPRGHLKGVQKERAKEELKKVLFGLKSEQGAPVIRMIFEREEIYRGPFLHEGPDLICLPHPGFDLKGNLRKKEVFTTDVFRGMHTWEDAVLVVPSTLKVDSALNIEHPARMVIDYFSS